MAKKKIVKKVFKEPFIIYQLPKPQNLRDFTIKTPNKFVSPVFGNDVKDEIVIPNPVKIEGDYDKRYRIFNKANKPTDEELIAKHGSKYYEFTNTVDSKERERVYGIKSNLSNDNTYEKNNNTANFEKNIVKPINDEQLSDVKPFTYTNVEIKPVEEEIKIETYKKDDYVESRVNKTEVNTIDKTSHISNNVKPHLIKDTTGVVRSYKYPSVSIFKKQDLDLLSQPDWLLDQIEIINQTLNQFSIEGRVVGTKKGPTVTRYEVSLEPGVNVRRVTTIQQNLEMNLSAKQMRIEAPIPGKPYVGIEVPNIESEIVYFGNIVDHEDFLEDHDNPLKVALGVDIDGENIYTDISKMPHGLIAGSTGSGKSVCINTILISLLLKNSPDDLKLILIDPKKVELNTYEDIPHLITPVVDEPEMAAPALNWAVDEMERRYTVFAKSRTRDIKSYNQYLKRGIDNSPKMPYIVIVIDELADLLTVAAVEVEEAIQRLTQKARAAGIHLLIATQRPSADVVKGTIKTNIPARLAFKVASHFDSNTILDGVGAEKLLGRGDMLLKEDDSVHRLQAAFITDQEIDETTNFIRMHNEPNYIFLHDELKQQVHMREQTSDELFEAVAYFVVENKTASINSIQRTFNVGFPRAQDLIIALEKNNIVSQSQGTRPRDVLVTFRDLDMIFGKIINDEEEY